MLLKSREREKAPSQGQGRKGAHNRESKASTHNTGAKHPWPFLIHWGGLGVTDPRDTGIWRKNTLHMHCLYLKSNNVISYEISSYNIGVRVLASKGHHDI